MYFISLLLILLILRYRRHWLATLQNDKLFNTLLKLSPATPWLQFTVTVLLPSMAVLLLLRFLDRSSLGLIELLLASVILMYSLGRGHFVSLFRRYKKACHDNQPNDIQQMLHQLSGYSNHNSFADLHTLIKQLLTYRALTHFFAVLFWFAALGPVAALFYRLNCLLADSKGNTMSYKLLGWMEWPAARLFAFSAALLGNFNAAIDYCKSCLSSQGNTAASIVYTATQLSLGLDQRDWQASRFTVEHSEEEIRQFAIEEVDAIQQLLHRCLILAVVGIAFLHIVF